MTYLATADTQTEDPRTTWRRRLQQQRCLVCGARQLAIGHGYFCDLHIRAYRFCSLCETLQTAAAHGADARCRSCANDRALRAYHADPDRTIYRIRLRQLAERRHTRGDQIFIHMRRRIALAELVRQTPNWSWPRRAALFGGYPQQLAYAWRQQNGAGLRDVDATDRARERYWSEQ